MTEVQRHGFSDAQIEILAKRSLGPIFADHFGIIPIETDDQLPDDSPDYWTTEAGYLPGLLFPYRSVFGDPFYQLRPDVPVVGTDGDTKKYVFPKDAPSVLNAVRTDGDGPLLITEGTCQTFATAAYAPTGVDVYGIAGCRSWMKDGVPTKDLQVVAGREVLVALDADAASNSDVFDAGVALAAACKAEGALSVRFIRTPGGGKAGLDDLLAQRDPENRSTYIENLIEGARTMARAEKPEQPAKARPKPKPVDKGDASPFFDGEKLKVQTLSEAVVKGRPAMLTAERKIALYRDGYYRIDGAAFLSEITTLLGENFRTSHLSNAEAYTVGRLYAAGAELPDRMSEPLMNVTNGMVDLRTGELLGHDPHYRSTTQFPIEWIADSTCPTYEAWAADQIGDQLDDLEESVSVMLDPTITPTKGVFLFGPSRSGKSTFLRLLQEIAGPGNYSAVTLHQLASDSFASANVYGKVLNVAADLSAAHVEDLSIYKMMTGEDPITANRKYGQQFSFINRALFAFSANELPTVGESSRAYSERIKPFHFGRSFAGAEDLTLEAKLRDELPGILRRLVSALQRRKARGVPLPTNSVVLERFELASDRVRQFVSEACEIVPVTIGRGGSTGATTSSITELYRSFTEWANDEGKASMAKSKMKARLSTVPGVVESISSGKSRGWNVRVLPRREWGANAAPAQPEKDGTLSVSALKGESRDTHSLSTTEAGETHVPVARPYGAKRTKFQTYDPASDARLPFLTERAAAYPTPECPDCDGPEELVPDTYFWHACRNCHPGTFTRSW